MLNESLDETKALKSLNAQFLAKKPKKRMFFNTERL